MKVFTLITVVIYISCPSHGRCFKLSQTLQNHISPVVIIIREGGVWWFITLHAGNNISSAHQTSRIVCKNKFTSRKQLNTNSSNRIYHHRHNYNVFHDHERSDLEVLFSFTLVFKNPLFDFIPYYLNKQYTING